MPTVPRRHCSYAALRHLAFIGRSYGLPLLRPTSVRALFCTGLRCTLTGSASEILAQAPLGLSLPEEGRDSPRLLGRPLVTRRGQRPRRALPRLAHVRRRSCCLRDSRILGHSETNCFGAVPPRLMPLRAYASFGGIAVVEARLATGLPGWALAGRVSHPLDGFSEFPEFTACLHSFPTSISWSHRERVRVACSGKSGSRGARA
jgi:hypothetical protein